MNIGITYKTKSAAIKAVKAAGYTVHVDTSSSGDYAYGSREYFAKPDSKKNEYGFPLSHATVSKLPGVWVISVFC